MLAKHKYIIGFIFFIIAIIVTLHIYTSNTYSKNNVTNLINKSIISNNIYIENTIYENNLYKGIAKFYIKDNIKYVYQENANKKQIEIYINNETNTSITVLHSEKIITQNNNTNNNNFELPLKNNLLDKLNNSKKYNYIFIGKEKINEYNCIKFSLTNNENNEYYNYYIDENTGYIIQYENKQSNLKEIYNYNINSVTIEQINNFNLNNYNDYTFINSI